MKTWIGWLALMWPMWAPAQILTVSAAASLTDAFKAIAPRFEASHPGNRLRLNFAASGLLLQQIAQGAPVDVFASADAATMDRAAAQKLIVRDTRRNFASNALVLVCLAEGTPTVQALADLADGRVKRVAVGKPASVPAGRYTQQALESAHLLPGLNAKLVFADNVRQVLDYVQRGEVDAGFVYRSDAELWPGKLRIVATVGGHDPIAYPVAVVSDSRQGLLAREFVAFLDSAEVRSILSRHGFSTP